MKTILYLIVAVVFLGCGVVYQKKFQLNKPFVFYYKSDYIKFLQEKQWYGDFNCLYLDSVSYFRYMSSEHIKSGNVVLQGLYVNDSLEVENSEAYLQKKYCTGAIIDQVKLLTEKANDSLWYRKANCRLSEFKLYQLSNNNLFIVDGANNTIKVMLGYSYAMGNYYDKLFNDIQKIARDNNMRLMVYVICLDPVYQLK